jgi:ribosomal protein S18 acetylase RimI-like enzyme
MTTDIQIRQAGSADIPSICDLAYAIWPVHYQAIISMDQIEYMLRNMYSDVALAEQMESGQRFFLCLKNGVPVGFMGLKKFSGSDLKVEKLYVLGEFQRLGLGRKLLDAAGEIGRNEGYSRLILNVNRMNSSFGFYQKLGFRIRNEVDIPYGPFWLNDYVMEKEIS